MRIVLSLVALCAMSLTAFAQNPPSPGPGNPCPIQPSGVKGLVERGPLQPVVRPGSTKPDTAPVAGAEIVVKDSKGNEVAKTKTDKDGKYNVYLHPGKYTVVGPKSGIRPGHWTRDIEVKAGQWLELNIKLDTGIRQNVKPAATTRHKLDLANLPDKLTVKVGDSIVFKASASPSSFAGWKLDANGAKLLKEALIRIYPPQLVVNQAGSGKLEIMYRDQPRGPVKSKVIELTVNP